MQFDSLVIHGGIDGDSTTGAVNVALQLSSTFKQHGIGEHQGFEYARSGNPTRQAVEKLIADLEGGTSGFGFASGLAAISAVLMLFKAGDTILISANVYGGTFRVLDKIFTKFGLNYQLVESANLNQIQQQLNPSVKAIFLETPTNPLMQVSDIAAISTLARHQQILTIVDNTFMTPYWQQPLNLGADIVVHSATKYLGGHSDLIAGLVVVKDPQLAQELSFIQNATGGVLSPFDSWLLIRGIKTLSVRLERQLHNTQHLLQMLTHHPAISQVYYPGLHSCEQAAIQQRQAKSSGAMLAFELTPNLNPNYFLQQLQLITLAESLGGVESLISHPASMTHAAVPASIRQQLGINSQLIRLSVGIEHATDLEDDLQQALTIAIQAKE